jgi:hypothetical protein
MKNKKQKIWEYMRRNKLFRVGDMMIVFDLKKSYANWILWFFKKEGLLQQVFSGKRFEDSVWKVIKDIGITSPNTTIKNKKRRICNVCMKLINDEYGDDDYSLLMCDHMGRVIKNPTFITKIPTIK